MKRLVGLAILAISVLLLVFQPPSLPTLRTVSATPLPGANSNVDKVWFNTTTTLIDQTTAANNPSPSDVQLAGNLGQMHIVGKVGQPFQTIFYNITGGVDVSGAVDWQYWNGARWRDFPAGTVVDGTKNFTLFNVHAVNFTLVPSDWANTTIPTSPRRIAFTAFYARAVTVKPYNPTTVPLAAQVSLLLAPRPRPPVRVSIQLWNGTAFPDASVAVWNATASGPTVTHSVSTTGGVYEFNATEHKLTNAEKFFFSITKVGYANLNTTVFTYNASLPVFDAGSWTLHGTLQVNVFKAANATQPVPLPRAAVEVGPLIISTGTSNATGTVEFGVNATRYSMVNVTVALPGWVDNNDVQNFHLTAGVTNSTRVLLLTTLKVTIVSELNFTVSKATVEVTDSTGTSTSVLEGSALDQDDNVDGILNWALNPGSISNPISVLVSRPGFSLYANSSLTLSSSRQLIIVTSPGLRYDLKVIAWDQLNTVVPLDRSSTSFGSSQLTISQVDYLSDAAYVAADPASSGKTLTIFRRGYVNSTTGPISIPQLPSFINQTITFKPSGGNGPGLPFAVKVTGVFNEIGKLFQVGTNATLTSTIGPPVANAFFPASTIFNVTASSPGYVDGIATITPNTGFQTTVLFKTGGTGAIIVKPGLLYTVKVISVSDELGSPITGASVTATGLTPATSGSNFYFPATTPITLNASALGYVNTFSPISPFSSSQTTAKFGTAGPSANITAAGLQFTVKVVGVYNEAGGKFQIGGNVTLTLSAGTFILSSGSAYIPASNSISLTFSATGYLNGTASVTPTSSQTTVLFQNATVGATTIRPALLFTVKVVSVSNELGGLSTALVSTPGVTATVYLNHYYFPLPASTMNVNLTAALQGYLTVNATVTASGLSQTTVRFGTLGPTATVNAPSLKFTVKVVSLADELGGSPVGVSVRASSGVGPTVNGGIFYFPLSASASVDLVATAPGYLDRTVTLTPSSSSQTTVRFGTLGSPASVNALIFTLKVRVSQSWDGAIVQGATVEVFTDPALINRIDSFQSDAFGNAYLRATPPTAYLQVSKTGYSTYKSSALQISSSSQTTSPAALAAKTSTVTAASTTVSVTANTNISNLSYDSTNNKITLTSASPSPGTVNATIPKQLIPSGYTVLVTSNGKNVTFTSTQDSNNVYLQIPTASGTNNLQVSFQAPTTAKSPLESPAVIAGIVVAVLAVLGVAVYTITRRRKQSVKGALKQPKPK